MRKFVRLIACTVLVLGSGALIHGQAKAAPSSDTPRIGKYSDLLKRVQGGDTMVSFLELGLAYSETRHYKPYRHDLDSDRNEMYRYLQEARYQDAIQSAQKILDEQFIDIEAHVVCAFAYDSLRDSTHSIFHQRIVARLIASIEITGTGSTPDSAYLVILIPEEYAIVNSRELQVSTQSLEQVGERWLDVFTVSDSTTKSETTIYFDISIPFRKMKGSFH
jgi:hypothetical protein